MRISPVVFVMRCLYCRHGISQQGSEISLTSLDTVIKLSSIKSNANGEECTGCERCLLIFSCVIYSQLMIQATPAWNWFVGSVGD